MNNFDFSWFLTTPGMLTCLGCLLIIIAIVIFISSIRSSKKSEEGEIQTMDSTAGTTTVPENSVPTDASQMAPAAPLQAPELGTTNGDAQTVTPVSPVSPVEVQPVNLTATVTPVEVQPVNLQEPPEPVAKSEGASLTSLNSSIEVQPVNPVSINPVATEQPAATLNTTPPAPSPEGVSPVEIQPVTPITVNQTPEQPATLNAAPTLTPTETVAPVEIQPVNLTDTNNNAVNTQQEPINIVMPTLQSTPEITPTTESANIGPVPAENLNASLNMPYGGTSPAVSESVTPSPETKVIYGGADPLAGTQVTPTTPQAGAAAKEDIESL